METTDYSKTLQVTQDKDYSLLQNTPGNTRQGEIEDYKLLPNTPGNNTHTHTHTPGRHINTHARKFSPYLVSNFTEYKVIMVLYLCWNE